MAYWLVKSEPDAYSWNDFVSAGTAVWDGVRNYQARNNLMAMKTGDAVLFYHSVEGKEVVGLAAVSREAYPDPSAPVPPDGKPTPWVVVELTPQLLFPKSVTLKQLKDDPILQNMALIRQSRLSVMPVRAEEFDRILALGEVS